VQPHLLLEGVARPAPGLELGGELGTSSIFAKRVVNRSRASRCTGNRKAIASPASNRTQLSGRVKRQFMVKVKGDQSVSITPPRGAMPSRGELGEPPTHRFQPGGVRNRPATWKVSTPWPKIDTGR